MNKKGVSAVVGVVLMVAITVAIAATVYLYVSENFMDLDDEDIVSGNITEKFRTGSYYIGGTVIYFFVIDDSFDTEVNEEVYYSYDVGDYYE